MTPSLNTVLEKIRLELEEDAKVNAAPPRLAEQELDGVEDAIDKFIAGIADQLVATLGMSEDAALDYVLDCCDEASEHGRIPPIPSEDADPVAVAVWLGKAQTAGFPTEVVSSAKAAHHK
jgi:hypothetical protein